MGARDSDRLAVAERFGAGPVQSWLANSARELNMWIVAGTMPLLTDVDTKVAPACLVFNSQGECVARYDKMHLFDVDIPSNRMNSNDSGRPEAYRESATFLGGTKPVVVDTPFGRIGLGVCYDMRFPELFRQYVLQGAQIITLPAAFTVPTGIAHWEVLLRARAIENLCYVMAPAQVGGHANGRETYGHSMIVGPWGDILARAEAGPGFACAAIDLGEQRAIRERFPALSHPKLLVK
jgi:nitrilase